ncbi:MAG: GtrA family protein, partial [Myxococcales bacterium]
AAVDRAAHLAFAALLVLAVAPLWVVAWVPTQDGGNHVESVMALLRLPRSALLQHYYVANVGLQPNWLTQILFAALVQVFAPATAEKLVLTGYAVLLPLAFRAALPATPRGRWAALAIFPFVHSFAFHMGFWNFSYSLVLFFVAVGCWCRWRGRLDARRGLAFCGITLALFVAHSVSLASAFAAITAVLAWRAGLDLARAWRLPSRRRRVARAWARRAAATYGWALPAIGLLGFFLVHQPKPFSYRPPLLEYVKHLVSLYALMSLDKRELFATAAVALVLVGSVAWGVLRRRTRRARPVDGWVVASAVAMGIFLAMPDSAADGAQLTDRLLLYPFFALALWIGWSVLSLRHVRAAGIALAVLFAALVGTRIVKYRELDRSFAEYASAAAQLAPGSVILPLTLSPYGPREGGRPDGRKPAYRVEVFRHVAGYLATEREGIDLDNSQATTKHAPLRWVPHLDPFHVLATVPFGMESQPAPCVDLPRYAAAGGRIDYVLLWGQPSEVAGDRCGERLLAQLAADWVRVFTSQPHGLMQVYRPKNASAAATSRSP